jgi:hypothetical protein
LRCLKIRFVVDTTYEIEETDDEEKNVEFMKTEDEIRIVSGVAAMIIALLEDSVLKIE